MNQSGYIAISGRRQPPISNGLVGTMLLVGTETILFSCFISAYMVLRMAAGVWPPAGTPSLHLGLSAFNTALLLLSSAVLFDSGRALRQGKAARARTGVLITLLMGTLFLALQGVEFHRLYERGLTLKSGPYGAVFFTLIGCHGLHVLGGLGYLGAALRPVRDLSAAIHYSQIYWYFVTAVWMLLFGILYIF